MKKSNNNNVFLFVIFFICVIYFIYVIFYIIKRIYFNNIFIGERETFESNNIDMYAISLKNKDRLENINLQQDKIGKTVDIFDAVKGDTLNSSELFKNGIIDKSFENASSKDLRVIGCYLSHLNLLKEIKNNNRIGYTIIFEDDFIIDSFNFLEDVHNILTKVTDFDLILLGNSSNNNKGEHIIDNIYKIDNDTPLWGTYGYLVNNKHTSKIVDNIKIVDMAIDNKFETLGKSGSLKIFVINPIIVNHNQDISSTINTEGFLSNMFSNKYYVF